MYNLSTCIQLTYMHDVHIYIHVHVVYSFLSYYMYIYLCRLAPQVGNDESNTSTLDKNDYCVLWQALVEWLKVLNELSETFSGEILLERQEGLQEIQKLMREWSEMALSVTHHHITPHTVESVTGDESVVVQDKEGLCSLVDQIKEFTKDLAVRTSGENGQVVYA